MNDPMSINEAARLTGLSIPTIRAKLDKGLLPNAKKVKQGKRNSWQIPLNDLLDAELMKAQPDQQETDKITELERKLESLAKDLEHTKELLEISREENQRHRERETRLYYQLETREAQDKRKRFRLFG